MDKIKFSAERFTKNGSAEIRFALRGNVLSAGIKSEIEAAGFALAEDIANVYYATASTPVEAAAIQAAIKPLMIAGKVAV